LLAASHVERRRLDKRQWRAQQPRLRVHKDMSRRHEEALAGAAEHESGSL